MSKKVESGFSPKNVTKYVFVDMKKNEECNKITFMSTRKNEECNKALNIIKRKEPQNTAKARFG